MDLLVNINIFEFDDDDIFIQRRSYTIRNKPNFQKWDDTEFFERFRLKKR